MLDRYWVPCLVVVLFALAPAVAVAQPQVGVVMWRHDTGLDVDHASDYGGDVVTAELRALDWETRNSGAGARVGYTFDFLTIRGELGVAQATLRGKNVSSPSRSVEAVGLDEGVYFGLGVEARRHLPGTDHVFWGARGDLRKLSTGLDQATGVHIDYGKTTFSAAGRAGYEFAKVDVYGGLRLTGVSLDLDWTDRNRSVGSRTRTWSFNRGDITDVLVGAEVHAAPVSGFVEVGMIGTFSVTTGVSMGL